MLTVEAILSKLDLLIDAFDSTDCRAILVNFRLSDEASESEHIISKSAIEGWRSIIADSNSIFWPNTLRLCNTVWLAIRTNNYKVYEEK